MSIFRSSCQECFWITRLQLQNRVTGSQRLFLFSNIVNNRFTDTSNATCWKICWNKCFVVTQKLYSIVYSMFILEDGVVVWWNSFSCLSLLSTHLLAALYSRIKKFLSEFLTFLYVVKFVVEVNVQLSEFSVSYHQNLFISNASTFLICSGYFQKRLPSDWESVCLPVAFYIPSILSKCYCKKDIELH